MIRRYYTSRNKPKSLTINELYSKLQYLYLYFRDKDYFKEKAGITSTNTPNEIEYRAALSISFQPFPITNWSQEKITEDHIFDVLEFLYDHVSKPGEWGGLISDETGYNYYGYLSYDEDLGKQEFREQANMFLNDYKTGYELTKDGMILTLGTDGLNNIIDADIIPYDEKNVDNKVKNAILKWRNRHLDIEEKRQAIRDLADVFEWLKKSKKLTRVLNNKDESAIFEIANNFHIRHHDPKQKRGYDETIWYAWIFHFYLATYHAVIRLLQKYESKKK